MRSAPRCGCHGGQGLDGLVLEQVARGELQPSWRARLTTWIDRIESPPSSKKLSCTPMRETLSTSRQICASCVSSSFAGAW
jgi:hypothetical protein